MTSPVPHLAGNYAPVAEELTAHDLPVTGQIPAELTGWYLRNGPNPHDAASRHWFTGDGMVHGIRIEHGRAVSYRNRWVRTKTFTDGARVIDDEGNRDLAAGVANTHVIRHAGRTLALVESSYPYELTCELDTVGPYDFDGALHTPMTAHPKTCPSTGELHFFGYEVLKEPYLTYHRADADGTLLLSRPIEVPAATMQHDFNLTAQHVVFMDLPVVFDLPTALAREGMPFRWSESYPARLGVLRRDDPHGEVRWFGIDPCYVFHTLNAHDEPGKIVLYVMRYPQLWQHDSDGFDESTLWRWTIDLVTGAVTEEQLDDRVAEFPRVDDRLIGQDARFGHVTVGGDSGALIRYDLHTGDRSTHEFGAGRVPAEAVFAPGGEHPGGSGYLMSFVYNATSELSDLVILRADDLAAAPVATVHLPQRVPFGFHGSWLPDV
ncbi:carotenoid oxygenase family protein [Nocardia brasiliensis]|uniref:Dioxygenase n=1 Tax=Nocardia brasiliensis (strain ATCC 700358 / HUJEG-1) TaxID=1133849 RepID=K0EKQ3_NOCB7|nr:carotenoid oxygenase family protein [Nocardia brasiliensis]AFU00028.1 carotenoid oxygenase [Nocardia brasiliensis ATCC 700358]OCF84961.1 9-cis-epoxycarotenoid dioxygenase [Nocardia brasiliensis]